MQAGLSTQNAPSVWVVVPHFLLGPVSFLLASVFAMLNYEAFLGYHISGPVLAVVHLMMLGWITVIIFGALYQLIPVVMEVKLFNERLAFFTLGFLVLGLIFLITAFFGYRFALTNNFIIGGSLIIIAVILFVVNTIKSALSSEKKNISRTYIMASVIYLMLTVLYGLFIVINLSTHWIPAAHTQLLKGHALIGLAGWFLMLIIGVAAKLMPMFLIVHKTKEHLLKWGFYLMNTGILILFVSSFFIHTPYYIEVISYLLVIAGLVMFLLFNYDVFSHRMRKKLDIGMKLSATGMILLSLGILSFIGVYIGNESLGLPAGRIEIISGILLIYGFFTGLILGQTYKTLPFIIWLYHYQALVGKQKTPLPAELYSDKLADIHRYAFLISIFFLVLGLLFSLKDVVLAGTVVMFFTSLVYGVNVFRMIFHKKTIIK